MTTWPGTPEIGPASSSWPGTPEAETPTTSTPTMSWPGTPLESPEPQPAVAAPSQSPPAESKPWAVTRGVMGGLYEDMPEAFGIAMKGAARFAPDRFKSTLDQYGDALIKQAEGNKAGPAMAPYKREAGSLFDIKDASSALTWFGENFGSGVASTVPSLVGGVGGFVAGGPVGAVTGAFVGAAAPNYAEVYKALKEEKVDDERAHDLALKALPIMSALDVAGEALPAARLLGIGQLRREIGRGIAKRVVQTGLVSAAAEGATEGAQEAAKLGVVSGETGREFLTKDTLKAIVESAVAGATVGTGFGTVAGLKSDQVQGAPQTPEEIAQVREQAKTEMFGALGIPLPEQQNVEIPLWTANVPTNGGPVVYTDSPDYAQAQAAATGAEPVQTTAKLDDFWTYPMESATGPDIVTEGNFVEETLKIAEKKGKRGVIVPMEDGTNVYLMRSPVAQMLGDQPIAPAAKQELVDPRTPLEITTEQFLQQNNLPELTTETRLRLIQSRIGQIERDRRASGVKEDGQYPADGELAGLRTRLRDLTTRSVGMGRRASGTNQRALGLSARQNDVNLRAEVPINIRNNFQTLIDARGTPNEADVLQRRLGEIEADRRDAAQRGEDVRGPAWLEVRTEIRGLRARLRELGSLRSAEQKLRVVGDQPDPTGGVDFFDAIQDVLNFGEFHYVTPEGVESGMKITPRTTKQAEEWYYQKPRDVVTIAQDKIDPNRVIVHDDIYIEPGVTYDAQGNSIPTVTKEKFTAWARARHGKRFDQLNFVIGRAFMAMRDTVAGVMGYPELKLTGVGVSYGMYKGVSIRIPYTAQFVNPGATQYYDVSQSAVSLISTMIHELAHHVYRGHDAKFVAEMQKIWVNLYANPRVDMTAFKNEIVNILTEYSDVFQDISRPWLPDSIHTIVARGVRLPDGSDQAGNGGSFDDISRFGSESESRRQILAATTAGTESFGPVLGRQDVRPTAEATRDVEAEDNLRHLEQALPATPAQRLGKKAARKALGSVPPQLNQMGAQASRMNWFYRWFAGLDQLVTANPRMFPLRDYWEKITAMHREAWQFYDAAERIAKDMRRLGPPRMDRVVAYINELQQLALDPAFQQAMLAASTNPAVLPQARAIVTQAETQLATKHQFDAEMAKVYSDIKNITDVFYAHVEQNAVERVTRQHQGNPAQLVVEIQKIRNQSAAFRARPNFPFMRFGRFYFVVRDAQGNIKHVESFERSGLLSAEKVRDREMANYALAPGDTIKPGVWSEGIESFVGMPPMLLQSLDRAIALGTEERQILEFLKHEAAPIPNYRRRRVLYARRGTPGYSFDFQRAFARYFFYGPRLYAEQKYKHGLKADIQAARDVGSTKAVRIADYMQEHYNEVVENPKGDIGWLKGGIFLWAMGYVPAAAVQNLTQTPMVTYPFLASGFGDRKATVAMGRAIKELDLFYTRGKRQALQHAAVQPNADFQTRALFYGIQSGRISESQASELAALSAGQSLMKGIGGSMVQRQFTHFMEGATFFFETAEQWNRRIAFRAALDLAWANPNAKVVQDAMAKYVGEYRDLTSAARRIPFTPDEARAVVTAIHAVESTQYVYAHYARPKIFRGKLLGTLFVFKKFLQSTLFAMFQNGGGFFVRYLLVATALGGIYAIPGADDLDDILNEIGKELFGKDFNIKNAVREYVKNISDGTIPPDLILHGLARKGFGLPALVDLLGSAPYGSTGRGLTAQPATTVPMPVVDMSRAISPGTILPFDVGKTFLGGGRDPNVELTEQMQKASGAVFGLGFNFYKFLHASEQPLTDSKRWERIIPRAAGALSRMLRTFREGRERGYGGPNSAPTIQTFDTRDTEQMMEVISMGLGFNPLSKTSQWDVFMAKKEFNQRFDAMREGLMHQFNEALSGGVEAEIEQVRQNIERYNAEVGKTEARAKVITSEQLRNSVKNRQRSRLMTEKGLTTRRSDWPGARSIEELFPEAIETRRVPR